MHLAASCFPQGINTSVFREVYDLTGILEESVVEQACFGLLSSYFVTWLRFQELEQAKLASKHDHWEIIFSGSLLSTTDYFTAAFLFLMEA